MTNLTDLLKQYQRANATAVERENAYANKRKGLHERLDEIVATWERENADEIEALHAALAARVETEAALREAMVAEYANTKNKQLGYGLSVRVNKRLDYDAKDALAWAKQHQLCLALDKKAFEKIAAVEPMEFVQTVETATAVIALAALTTHGGEE